MRLAEHIVALPYRRFCGREVQGYRLGNIVGIGGSGVVFDAVAPDGQPVVLKLLRPLRGTINRAAVWDEVAPLGSVNHPAVPAWLGIVRQGKAYYIVLSSAPGKSLSQWLFVQRHAFPREEILRVGAALAGALVHLHQHGVAHGDLRPANVMYDGTHVSLVDFGMSTRAAIAPLEDTFAAACAQDYAGFADLVLYLLYSSCDFASTGSNYPAGCWQDELQLTSDQRTFLENALSFALSRAPSELQASFVAAFGASAPLRATTPRPVPPSARHANRP